MLVRRGSVFEGEGEGKAGQNKERRTMHFHSQSLHSFGLYFLLANLCVSLLLCVQD